MESEIYKDDYYTFDSEQYALVGANSQKITIR
jgi:hypothetical protein